MRSVALWKIGAWRWGYDPRLSNRRERTGLCRLIDGWAEKLHDFRGGYGLREQESLVFVAAIVLHELFHDGTRRLQLRNEFVTRLGGRWLEVEGGVVFSANREGSLKVVARIQVGQLPLCGFCRVAIDLQDVATIGCIR